MAPFQCISERGKKNRSLLFGVLSVLAIGLTGCGPEAVQVALLSRPICFTMNHHGWPRPFWWPRVNEFALANDRDELLWHLKSVEPRGELARQLVFAYGRVPKGFYQVFPEGDKAPPPLQKERIYFVAAGGEQALYRTAFSLPMEVEEFRRRQQGLMLDSPQNPRPTTTSAPAKGE